MAEQMGTQQTGTLRIKTGFAEMFKGGVIMDVVNAEQARIAEAAGATAVMALERVPADIRAQGGVARMSDPSMIEEIIATVSVPVMAKARIGHFVEAQILQALGVDFIDESEVLTPADENFHIDKHAFTVPFVCGAKDLGEALRRVGEGATMIRTKGEAGTGNVVEAVRHARAIVGEIRRIQSLPRDELMSTARDLRAPYELVLYVHEHGKLPVVNFAAGGIATPADAALMMQLGMDGVFVGSGIFKAGASDAYIDLLATDKEREAAREKRKETHFNRARAIVEAVTHYRDAAVLAEVSRNLGAPMVGINIDTLPENELMAARGW